MSDFTNTPYLGLYKPNPGFDLDVWGAHWNLNADTLDAKAVSVDAAIATINADVAALETDMALAQASIVDLQASIDGLETALPTYLPLAGGVMTGPTWLRGTPGTNPVVIRDDAFTADPTREFADPVLLVERQGSGPTNITSVAWQGPNNLDFWRVNGTPLARTPLTVGQFIVQQRFGGWNGAAWSNPAASFQVVVPAGGDWSATSTPTDLIWSTTPIGATSGFNRMRLFSTGQLNVGAGSANVGAVQTAVINAQTSTSGLAGFRTLVGGATGLPAGQTQAPGYLASTSGEPSALNLALGSWAGFHAYGASGTIRPLFLADGIGGPGRFLLRRAGGSAGAPTFPGNGAELGGLDLITWAGSGVYQTTPGTSLRIYSIEAHNAAALGTAIDLQVTQKAGLAVQTAATFTGATTGSYGHLLLGKLASADVAGQLLQVAGIAQADTLQFGSSAGTGNYGQLAGAAAGVAPSVIVAGVDTNIDLRLVPKGTGSVVADTGSGAYTSPTAANSQMLLLGADGASSRITLQSHAQATQYTGVRSQGTRAAPTAVTNALPIVTLQAYGHDGTAWSAAPRGLIQIRTSQTWGATAHGTEILFNTTVNDTTTTATKMTLTNAGALNLAVGGIGLFGTAAPSAKPTVSGSRAGNAALQSLITILATTFGFCIDGTTA